MKKIVADHKTHVYLKPGEVIVSRNPILVSTILGSCVAITMFSPSKKTGAICHAMFPCNANREKSLHCVDTAVRHIYGKMIEYGGSMDMVVKLFGGAQVLAGADYEECRKAIGEQNIIEAKRTLEQLGLAITKTDTGGNRGRKLLFSIKTGDVYLRRLRLNSNTLCVEE